MDSAVSQKASTENMDPGVTVWILMVTARSNLYQSQGNRDVQNQKIEELERFLSLKYFVQAWGLMFGSLAII